MKPKLTSEFDGVLNVNSMPVHYSILPDGRRIIIAHEVDKTHLDEVITPNVPGAIKFQNRNGLVCTGIDVKMFPAAITSHIQKAQIPDLEHYAPWLIFCGLFLLGSISLLQGSEPESDRVDFSELLKQVAPK